MTDTNAIPMLRRLIDANHIILIQREQLGEANHAGGLVTIYTGSAFNCRTRMLRCGVAFQLPDLLRQLAACELTKVCRGCGRELPLGSFGLRDREPDGHEHRCKRCEVARMRGAATR